MTEPVQQIRVDHARKLIDVRVAGYVTPEDASWLGEDVRAAIRTLGDGMGEHVTLYDVRALDITPGETIDMVKTMLAHPAVRPLWARKVAIVSASALGRLQMGRLREVRGDIAIFEERDQALDWLLAA